MPDGPLFCLRRSSGSLAVSAVRHINSGAGGTASNYLNPTKLTYDALRFAYDNFNQNFFGDQLRQCLITVQRRRTACGFFAKARFISHDRSDITDEIGLDPRYWGPPRTDIENLATLAHEMVHLWQHHHGKAGRGGYHNREFAHKMFEIGLITSDTGEPGGKRTGTRMSDYIAVGGPFHRHCLKLIDDGFVIPYVEILSKGDEASQGKRRRSRAASKMTYTCPQCDPPVHAWGKQSLHLICGTCESTLVTEPSDAGWEAEELPNAT